MAKKLISLAILFLIICLTYYPKLPIFGSSGSLTVITDGQSDGEMHQIQSGNMQEFFKLTNITGQSLKTVNLDYIIGLLNKFDCKFLFCERVDGVLINYYYSPKIWGYKPVNGKKVNITVAKNDIYYTISTPIMYVGA